MSQEKRARNRRMVAVFKRDPSLSWQELGDRFGLTRARARQVIVAELGEVRKPPRALALHPCQAPGCKARFAHRHGYKGRNCPLHRRTARNG